MTAATRVASPNPPTPISDPDHDRCDDCGEVLRARVEREQRFLVPVSEIPATIPCSAGSANHVPNAQTQKTASVNGSDTVVNGNTMMDPRNNAIPDITVRERR